MKRSPCSAFLSWPSEEASSRSPPPECWSQGLQCLRCPWATQNKPRQESTVEWSNLAAEDQAPTAGPQQHDTRPTCPEEGTANVLEHSGVAGKHKDDDPVCGRRSNRVQTGNLMCTSPPSPIELTVVTGMLAGAEHLYSASLLWSTKPPHWIVWSDGLRLRLILWTKNDPNWHRTGGASARRPTMKLHYPRGQEKTPLMQRNHPTTLPF